MFGLSKYGFKRKQYSDILSDMQTRARNLFGEDINLTERSPLGIFLMLIAWTLSLIWQVVEHVYHQTHLQDAEGISLDYIAEKANIYRFPALKSYGEVIFTGKPGKKIYKGFKVSTANKIIFETTKEVRIGDDGTVKAIVRSLELGEIGNVQATAIDTIVNPEMDVHSVSNPIRFAFGREIETDTELRLRYKLSFEGSGKATIDAIVAHLRKVPTIKGVSVVENDTMGVVNGIPPKSIRATVLGGEDKDVAQAILDSKAAGIQAYGKYSYDAIDNQGKIHRIYFDRATEVEIYANFDIAKARDSSAKDEEIIADLKTRFKDYIKTIPMGGVVVASRAAARLMCGNKNVYDVIMTIGKTPDKLSMQNIQLLDYEIATTRDDIINVTDNK